MVFPAPKEDPTLAAVLGCVAGVFALGIGYMVRGGLSSFQFTSKVAASKLPETNLVNMPPTLPPGFSG
jgi:hypothetical protein